MRINSIAIPEHITKEFGLERIEMKDMGRVVIIAGKNGSGKTRLLNLIKENDLILQTKFSEEKERRNKNLDGLRKAQDQLSRTISEYEAIGEKNLTESQKQDYRFSVLKQSEIVKDILENEKHLKIEILRFEEGLPKGDIFEFVPKSVSLKDPDLITKKEFKSFLKPEKTVTIEDLPEKTYGIIQALQDFALDKVPSKKTQSDVDIVAKNHIDKFERLKDMIINFLGSNLGRDILTGDTQIFEKSFNEANLSEGQRVLLQLCVALIESKISLENAILIMDEPENHLHPKILIDLLEKILEENKSGQIWIATHSIPLIAHFDPSCIWLMDNNKVHFAGRNPEKVIDNLVGDKEKERLTNFLNLPAMFASVKFASECLQPPAIVNTDIADPQTNQINKIISNIVTHNKKVSMLDFGAGKGRLLKLMLQLREINSEQDSSDFLEYYAYDIPQVDETTKKECQTTIDTFYKKRKKTTSIIRYFTSKDQMYFDKDEMFDIIVMCNVFHEIDPTEWIKLFSFDEIIQRHLKDNGFLLIVEDQQMPIGERAYKNGFMVFGEAQFRKLFNIKNKDQYVIDDARKDGRLLAHLIAKKNIKTINSKSIFESIKSLKEESLDKISHIKKNENSDFKTGMKLSFWLNQYANASLNIQNFPNPVVHSVPKNKKR